MNNDISSILFLFFWSRCCEILNQSQLSTWHICDAIGQLIKRYSIEFRAVWLIGLCDLFASLSFASEHFVRGLLNILPASRSAMENYFMQFESGSLSSVIYLLCNTHHINASNWEQFVLTFLCDHVCKHRDKFSTGMKIISCGKYKTVESEFPLTPIICTVTLIKVLC